MDDCFSVENIQALRFTRNTSVRPLHELGVYDMLIVKPGMLFLGAVATEAMFPLQAREHPGLLKIIPFPFMSKEHLLISPPAPLLNSRAKPLLFCTLVSYKDSIDWLEH